MPRSSSEKVPNSLPPPCNRSSEDSPPSSTDCPWSLNIPPSLHDSLRSLGLTVHNEKKLRMRLRSENGEYQEMMDYDMDTIVWKVYKSPSPAVRTLRSSCQLNVYSCSVCCSCREVCRTRVVFSPQRLSSCDYLSDGFTCRVNCQE